MSTIKRIPAVIFTGICFLSGVVVLVVYIYYATSRKNILTDTLISWGTGWNNYESRYAGSEFSIIAENTSTISIGYQLNTKADQGIEILIDGTRKNSSPEDARNDILLSYTVNPKQRHTIVFRHYCSYLYYPCDLTVTQLSINRSGRLLPIPIHKPILTVLGDSISTIYGSENYTRILADALLAQLHNASIMGSTVTQLPDVDSVTRRYTNDIQHIQSKYAVLFIGSNDAGNHVSLQAFADAYSGILSDILKWNISSKVILVGILPRKDIDAKIITSYNTVIQEISRKYNVFYVDTTDWIQYSDLSDDIHPSKSVQKIIAEKLLQFIRTIEH